MEQDHSEDVKHRKMNIKDAKEFNVLFTKQNHHLMMHQEKWEEELKAGKKRTGKFNGDMKNRRRG